MIGRMSIRTKCRKKLSQPRGRNPCQRLYQRCLLLKRPPSPNWSPQRIQPWRTLKFQVKKGSKPTAKAPIRWSLWLWQALLRRAQHPSILLFRRPIPYLLCMSIVKKVSKVKKKIIRVLRWLSCILISISVKYPDPVFDCVSENVLETWQKNNHTFKKTEYTMKLEVAGKTYFGSANTKKAAKTAVATEAWNIIRSGTM